MISSQDDPVVATARRPAPAARRRGVAAVTTVGIVAVLALAGLHLTQGTSGISTADLLALAAGQNADQALAVLLGARLPRLLAGVLVGLALGVAGALLQSVARNPLASPDTLAVNSGAHLAVVAFAAFGVTLPVLPAAGIALLGGTAAAAAVLGLSAGEAAAPTRLILAGSAVTLALHALTMLLLLLYEEATVGLFAWGSGSLVQTGLEAVGQMAPIVALGICGALLVAQRLDVLALGDDTAAVLGIDVGRTRVAAVVVAVLLSAAAVSVSGPIGFVGLVAPVLVRLAGARLPAVYRHRVLLPLSGLAGVLVVLAADVTVRAALGAQAGVDIPTGVVTTMFGAAVLVELARRRGDDGPTRPARSAARTVPHSARRAATVIAVVASLTVFAAVVGMLAGDMWVLSGDIVNWVSGRSGRGVTYVLDARFPRVLAALLAGAALGVAGTTVQAVCRNALAEPSLLGITGGAGVAAVCVITLVPGAGIWTLTAAAAAGALAAFALVYRLASRDGPRADRLVLIGAGLWWGGSATITFIIVLTDPWNTALALTWLSGSTYGRTLAQVVPVLVVLAAMVPAALAVHRDLDVTALDDDTPRVLGIRVERVRLAALAGSAVLAATAVSAIGVVGFVGLVAPHMARTLVGALHARVVPAAALLGALVVSVADTLGRTVIAPAQIPAGLLTALIGAPYFVWLLWRSRPAGVRR